MQRKAYLPIAALAGIILAGCPKTDQSFDAGKKAEAVQDYDTALVDYERALRTSPTNAEYKLRAMRMRSMDSQFHLQQGEKFLDQGQVEMALAEFEKAAGIDPSNMAAQQELQRARDVVEEKRAASEPKQEAPPQPQFVSSPPELKPQIREVGALTMTNNSTVVFETIAKLAGLSVIFDPDFHAQRISVQLPTVSVEQALQAVALASKSFWQPLTPTVIFVAPDNPQNRREYEDEIVKTFYLGNTLTPQDLTEIVTGLRSMLNIQKIVQMNSENAIVMRATPDEVAAASKIIDSIDRARPEVLIHVQVLTANRDRLRDLGILPGQSVAVQFTPRTALQPSSGSSSSSGGSGSGTGGSSTSSVAQVTLNNLHSLGTADWSATLPGATAQAILTDNQTHIIQDPEIRITDGERAKLTIGERIPVATGSFQAGIGVGVAATGVSPLVNTQFTYDDVGVILDVQPRVHPDNEISMKLSVDISSLAGSSNIGGINQPIIAQNKIDEGEIRLKEGEASILGGLITRTETVNVNGIPGLAQIPLMKYLFSENSNQSQDQEVLILLTPHVVRFSPITAQDLRSLDTGSDMNVRVYREQDQALAQPAPNEQSNAPTSPAGATNQQPANAAAGQLQFDPANVTIKQGDTATIGLKIANVSDLFSIPLLIHYNPAVIQISEIRDGGFLSGGNQAIPIVQHIDPQRGEAVVSATRQPNTPGVSGTGTLLGVVVKAVGPGTSNIQILEVNARNAQQKTIPLVSGEATVQVQ